MLCYFRISNKPFRDVIARTKFTRKEVEYFETAFPTFAMKEVLPRQTKKVFLPNGRKPSQADKVPCVKRITGPRVNDVEIQMLPMQIYKQIFKDLGVKPSKTLIEQCRKTLQEHGMVKSNEPVTMPDVDFKLPPIYGKNLEEHFQMIGEEQAQPYRALTEELLKSIPPMPTSWVMQAGWTRYAPNRPPETVAYPAEEALVFDVEVCMGAGKAPTLATAVTREAWYGWVSQSVLEGTSKPVTGQQYSEDVLIPLESAQTMLHTPKVIIGHNVSYDRARIREQYWLERTGARFIDTMSLHVCVSGLTSYQRAVLKSGEKNDEDDAWKSCSSLNSLSEVYKLYCSSELEKETRDVFVHGSLADIQQDFQRVMSYCAKDVQATYDVLQKLFPLFLQRFPHPVTLAGMLELSTAYLPVNSSWERYLNDAEQTYDDLDIEARIILARSAEHACQLLHGEKYKEDVWMWDQDWGVKEIKLRKSHKVPKKNIWEDADVVEDELDELFKKFQYLDETRRVLPAVRTLLPGYPNWFRKLSTKPDSTPDWVPGPHLISTAMQVTPKLLQLTWEGYPLHYIRGKGWGLLVPFATGEPGANTQLPLKALLEKCPVPSDKPKFASNLENLPIDVVVQYNLTRKEYYSRAKPDKSEGLYQGSGVWCKTILEDSCFFFKLPHKDGAAHRVGNPLAKDFLNKFSENVLAGDTESAEKVLAIARMLSYWRNNRDRIMEQMVVFLEDHNLPKRLRTDENRYGAIVPQVVVSGTLTRRAVEPTWMTASNAHPERVGSELRSMVQAPPGYNIVGADVDSQELWIASVIGDAHYAKMHGATPFGWMTLSGNKAESTDMHSVTAKAIGISRDHAKVINYARIYGAGQNFAERLLKQFNPTMSEAEAKSKATKMFNLTKGKRVYRLHNNYLLDFPDKPYSRWQAFEIAKVHGKSVEEIFLRPRWVGGTESAMFNRLEEIAASAEPVTPFLNGRLTRSLEPKSMPGDRFLPTRVNWVVQSGAVDFLHLMLVCMRWIMRDKARFCLSFHDEVRYLVPEEFKYEAALAMHVTNLLTRAFCASRLGLDDLPLAVAFFSSVEVDTVLRKEGKHDCKTPSNPNGLLKGYGVANGESLDIYEAIRKARGQTTDWYKLDSNPKFLLVPEMSRATKRKHVLMEVLQDDFSIPTKDQQIVKILSSRGNNLHEVEATDGSTFLISMPTKFRKNIWVKRGDFVLVEPIKEGDKVKAEMVRVLTNEHVKYFKKDGVWPGAFDERKGDSGSDGDLFVNTNRVHENEDCSSSEASSDEGDTCGDGIDEGLDR